MRRKSIRKIIIFMLFFVFLLLALPNVPGFSGDFTSSDIIHIKSNNDNEIDDLSDGEDSNNINGVWRSIMKDNSLYKHNLASYANDKNDMKSCYSFLKDNFFSGCNKNLYGTYKDFKSFYDIVNDNIMDAKGTQSDLSMDVVDLSEIVNVVKNKKNPYLWCHQQAIFLAAGIKASLSTYNETYDCYLVDKDINISMNFVRSFDIHFPILPYRSHVQLVITYYDIYPNRGAKNHHDVYTELDTWDNFYGKKEKSKFTGAKVNSVLEATNIDDEETEENFCENNQINSDIEINLPIYDSFISSPTENNQNNIQSKVSLSNSEQINLNLFKHQNIISQILQKIKINVYNKGDIKINDDSVEKQIKTDTKAIYQTPESVTSTTTTDTNDKDTQTNYTPIEKETTDSETETTTQTSEPTTSTTTTDTDDKEDTQTEDTSYEEQNDTETETTTTIITDPTIKKTDCYSTISI